MGHRIPRRAARREGFTLLEIMIYLVVLAIIGIPIVMVTLSMSRASAEGDMLSKILERNRSSLQRITSEFRHSLQGTALVLNGGKTLQFTSCTGFDGAGPVGGPVIRYDIRSAPGDPANGADDNHNGIIDEGILIRADQSTGQEIVLTNALNASSSSFTANGNGVRIALTTAGWTKGSSAPTEVQRAVTVYPRN